MSPETDIDKQIKYFCDVSDEMTLGNTVMLSVGGGLFAAASTTVGGLLLGPIGLFVGAVIGGGAAAAATWGRFVPASEAIKNLSANDKRKLVDYVNRGLAVAGLQHAVNLATAGLAGENVVKQVAASIAGFFHDVMNVKIAPKDRF